MKQDTLTVDLKVAGPDFIITTPKQLEEAFTLWYKRAIESPAYYDRDSYKDDPKGVAASNVDYLIHLLRELNGNDPTQN